jgi:hypothetical protein
MPWAVLKAPPTTEMEITGDNGVRYVITWRSGESFLPMHLFSSLMRQGLIDRGDKPDPKPRFEKLAGNVNGKPVSPFSEFVREVTT